jgi:fused signal recognition particle receptor
MELAAAVIAVVVLVAVVTVVVRRRRGAAGAPRRPPIPAPGEPGLRDRLGKTRRAVAGRLAALGGRARLDDTYWQEVEDVLVSSDVGVDTAAGLVAAVREAKPPTPDEAQAALSVEIGRLFEGRDRGLRLNGTPAVVLVVGVNGGGKTTSIAKLAARISGEGGTVVLGAADTFRAAADSQLRAWADRVGVDVVAGSAGADPAAVAFDALASARARSATAVIVDTAGRLQSKSNLMDELAKVARVLEREAGAIDEVLLVIDGTTGQDAVAQARVFSEAVGVTGIVLTKLDGTARGGVAIAIERELGIPVKFIGVGEGVADLIPFEPGRFADAIAGA